MVVDHVHWGAPTKGSSGLVNTQGTTNTGGEGAFTQWVWVELIESTETIHPANTHQVHAEFI